MPSGKRQWEKVGTSREGYSLELAAQIRGERIRSARHPELKKPQRYSFGELAREFLRWGKTVKGDVVHDETRWRLHLEPVFGRRCASEISRRDIDALVETLLRAGKAPATVRRVVALFRAIWNRALTWGMVSGDNPASRVRLPAERNGRERILGADELRRLLAELEPRSAQAHTLTMLGAHTGARKGELLRLTWSDVDFASEVIVLGRTKNGTTRRIPMNGTLRAYLIQLRASDGMTSYVIPRSRDREIGTVTQAWQDAADRLFNRPDTPSRQRVVFHSLRHTFTSRLVAAGVPLRVVQELTGHKTLSQLQRYAHLLPGAAREAVKVLEEQNDADS